LILHLKAFAAVQPHGIGDKSGVYMSNVTIHFRSHTTTVDVVFDYTVKHDNCTTATGQANRSADKFTPDSVIIEGSEDAVR